MAFTVEEVVICMILVLIIIGALGCALFIKFRPLYPAKVECWFCADKCTVPYENRNCWDCPSCGQYNGFTEDGDYNKPIPSQFTEDFNHPITGFRGEEDNAVGLQTSPSGLCETCSRHQALKVKRLANFVPFDETHHDEEVVAYQRHLEYIHRLCRSCERLVQYEINRQDARLSDMMEEHYYQERLQRRKDFKHDVSVSLYPQRKTIPVQGLFMLAALSAICLGSADLQVVLPGRDFPAYLDNAFYLVHTYSLGVVLAGVLSLLLGIFIGGRERLLIRDGLACVVWAGLVFHYINCYVGRIPPQELTERTSQHYLGMLLNGAALATTLFMVFWPRYFISRRISLIRKRISAGNDSRLSSNSGSPSPRRIQPALVGADRYNLRQRVNSGHREIEAASEPLRNTRELSIPRLHTLRIGTPPRERPNYSGFFSPFGGRQSPVFGSEEMSRSESLASFHSAESQSFNRAPSVTSLNSATSSTSLPYNLRSSSRRPLIHPPKLNLKVSSNSSCLSGQTVLPRVNDDDSVIGSASTTSTRSSSSCPVGSTTIEPEPVLPRKNWTGILQKKILWQCILGVSLGLNVTYLGVSLWSYVKEKLT